MKIIVTGSLGNISKPLTEKLVASGHDVTVISSKDDKVSAIEALGAHAAIGSVEDVAFLTETFRGADAVYTMVPPTLGASDWKRHIAAIGKNYVQAVKGSGVKKVVNLSSIGADQPSGAGPVSGLYFVEKEFNALEDVDVLHLRPASFYVNFYGNVSLIKQAGIIGSNYGPQVKQVLVHPKDIANVAAEALDSLSFTGKSFRYIASDERTGSEVAAVLGAAIGKPELPWVEFADGQLHDALIQAGLPQEIASNFVEMGVAVREGRLTKHYHEHADGHLAPTRLESFAKEFAAAF